MKLSLNWIRQYTDIKLSVDELVEKIGAQLGAVEETQKWGVGYGDILVVKVVTCEKHSNADKLHVCLINDSGKAAHVKRNSDGLVQVVCGAPNVKAGMLAAWIPPGVTVPSTMSSDPFVIEAREIRGEMSNGMLASAHELGFSDDHTGIVELNSAEIKPGMSLAEVKNYALDDMIIEVENKMFTHRPDCFGALGVAREIAGITHQPFKSPNWYLAPSSDQLTKESSVSLPLTVENKLPKLTPRFMAVALSNITVGPSPIWLQTMLTRVGSKPINNVVDITNFMMLLTGQPLHAYDYDKVGEGLIVRAAEKGEKLKLLGGKEITLRAEDIVIADRSGAIGLGGVMGGADTEVSASTKNIILECANFDMYTIRKTMMEHGLFTDAAIRFIKGQSPEQNDRVLAQAVQMLKDLAGALVAGKVHDIKNFKLTNERLSVDAEFINERLGTKLSLKEIAKLLENVEFKILSVPADKKRLHISPPFWRTDIEIAEDIVEEVGRLYGYDHLPLELPTRTIKPTMLNEMISVKSNVRQVLSAAGANEVLTYSFVHGNLLQKAGQDKKNAYELNNAISPDLQYYRLSLAPSLLDKVHPNIKAGHGEFALFEVNQVHSRQLVEENLPIEKHKLGLVFAADDKTVEQKYSGAAYYQAKKYLEVILDHFDINSAYEPLENHAKEKIDEDRLSPYEHGRSALVKTAEGEILGEIGEFKTSVRRGFKLPTYCAGFEIDLEKVLELGKTKSYTPLPRFPKVEQDISLSVPEKLPFGDIEQFIDEKVAEKKPEDTEYSLTPIDIYQPGGKDDRHITLRLSIASYERTLKSEDINTLLDEVAVAANEKFGVTRL